MKIYSVVVVEESECFDFKLLETSGGIVVVIKRCISWASVGKMYPLNLCYSVQDVRSHTTMNSRQAIQFMPTV